MKKFAIAGALALAAGLGGTAVAGTRIVAVSDPTAGNGDVFSGNYTYTDTDGTQKTGRQTGYIGVYDDGVVACNGNPSYTNPQDGSPLQGYIWVGSGEAADVQTAADPTGNVGAGHGDGTKGHSPCPDANPTTP